LYESGALPLSYIGDRWNSRGLSWLCQFEADRSERLSRLKPGLQRIPPNSLLVGGFLFRCFFVRRRRGGRLDIESSRGLAGENRRWPETGGFIIDGGARFTVADAVQEVVRRDNQQALVGRLLAHFGGSVANGFEAIGQGL